MDMDTFVAIIIMVKDLPKLSLVMDIMVFVVDMVTFVAIFMVKDLLRLSPVMAITDTVGIMDVDLDMVVDFIMAKNHMTVIYYIFNISFFIIMVAMAYIDQTNNIRNKIGK